MRLAGAGRRSMPALYDLAGVAAISSSTTAALATTVARLISTARSETVKKRSAAPRRGARSYQRRRQAELRRCRSGSKNGQRNLSRAGHPERPEPRPVAFHQAGYRHADLHGHQYVHRRDGHLRRAGPRRRGGRDHQQPHADVQPGSTFLIDTLRETITTTVSSILPRSP